MMHIFFPHKPWWKYLDTQPNSLQSAYFSEVGLYPQVYLKN